MGKNVLVISSSYRSDSNSDILAMQFVSGAEESGNKVVKIDLKKYNYAFCKGCLCCHRLGHCIINDDAVEIAEAMCNADVIAFASPVYYYNISGQLKTLMDRANPLYFLEYKFRKVYLIAVAAESEPSAVEGSKTSVKGWVDCFENAEFCGTVFAGGVNEPGEVKNHKAMQEAYDLGKTL